MAPLRPHIAKYQTPFRQIRQTAYISVLDADFGSGSHLGLARERADFHAGASPSAGIQSFGSFADHGKNHHCGLCALVIASQLHSNHLR